MIELGPDQREQRSGFGLLRATSEQFGHWPLALLLSPNVCSAQPLPFLLLPPLASWRRRSRPSRSSSAHPPRPPHQAQPPSTTSPPPSSCSRSNRPQPSPTAPPACPHATARAASLSQSRRARPSQASGPGKRYALSHCDCGSLAGLRADHPPSPLALPSLAFPHEQDQMLQKIPLPEKLSCFALSPTGAYCAGGTISGHVYLWEVRLDAQ